MSSPLVSCFNTQPPEGGWLELESEPVVKLLVSTHSRPKAAGNRQGATRNDTGFQHTAARRRLAKTVIDNRKVNTVSTHSRPKAAGAKLRLDATQIIVSTHSRPKAAGFRKSALIG